MTNENNVIEFPSKQDEEPEELTEQQLAAGIVTLDQMNREALQENPFALFLYRLNSAVLRTGKPVPRYILLEAGITKQGLKQLLKDGYLKETRLRTEKYGEVPCYALAEGVAFTTDEEGRVNVEIVDVVPVDS